MGARGPVGKRSNQRHGHRTEAEKARTTKSPAGEAVDPPDPDELWHRNARDWYDAIRQSGQRRFFEATDWQTAWFCASLMSQVLTDPDGPSASMVAQIRGLMTDLLATEGARRRVSLELERSAASSGAGDEVVAELDAYRRRSGSAAG